MVAHLSEYTKTHWTVHFKSVNFMMYISKAVKMRMLH